MQHGFFQKLFLCMICGAAMACLVEFYKNFIEGADNALNGSHKHVKPAVAPPTPGH